MLTMSLFCNESTDVSQLLGCLGLKMPSTIWRKVAYPLAKEYMNGLVLCRFHPFRPDDFGWLFRNPNSCPLYPPESLWLHTLFKHVRHWATRLPDSGEPQGTCATAKPWTMTPSWHQVHPWHPCHQLFHHGLSGWTIQINMNMESYHGEHHLHPTGKSVCASWLVPRGFNICSSRWLRWSVHIVEVANKQAQ